eukprot:2964358-Amphidinium_carterae.1
MVVVLLCWVIEAGAREVDTVLTTTELLSLIAESVWAPSPHAEVTETFSRIPLYPLPGHVHRLVLSEETRDQPYVHNA